MSILIFLIIVISCLKKPMFGLALLLQINIIRSLVSLEFNNPCYNCINEADLFLGGITPIVGIITIFLTLILKKKVKYVFDFFDLFFLVSVITLFFTSIYSFKFLESLNYSLKFLLLGSGYYFIAKILILNLDNPVHNIKRFLIYSLWLAIILGTFGGVFYLFVEGTGGYRLTIPGVHPIPFSQLIGLGILVSFMIFITNGAFFDISSKVRLNINKAILPYLILLLLATNTRGVLLATVVGIFIYNTLSGYKIKKSIIYISGAVMAVSLIIAINYIDIEVLFRRLLAKQTEQSVNDRFIAYADSFSIFLDHPFGIGPDAFKYYSILPYPHNIFLELLSQYGIFGLFISLLLIFIIIYMLNMVLLNRKRDLMYLLLFILFFYFFIETNFSFTLWMHRGMYLFLGLFAGYQYRQKGLIKLRNYNEIF